MEQLKVCFVGIGSIAKRHIRNLSRLCEKYGIELTVDAFRHRNDGTLYPFLSHIYYDPDDVPDDYDAVFITNPTEMHLPALRQFHQKGRNFFIEKPAVSTGQIREARQMELRKDSVYYVACPLRYNAVIQYIKSNIDPRKVISVRSISSSYLPDWRPGQDYRATYSAHKALGGGVSIDLIHEWDYISYLFGWPEKIECMMGRKSSLEIDSDDYAVYIAEYADKIVELHLDYFGRKTIREIELFMEDETVIGDIVNGRIHFLRSGRMIELAEDRDDFQLREMDCFLKMVSGLTKADDNGFFHGIRVLELTQGCCNGQNGS